MSYGRGDYNKWKINLWWFMQAKRFFQSCDKQLTSALNNTAFFWWEKKSKREGVIIALFHFHYHYVARGVPVTSIICLSNSVEKKKKKILGIFMQSQIMKVTQFFIQGKNILTPSKKWKPKHVSYPVPFAGLSEFLRNKKKCYFCIFPCWDSLFSQSLWSCKASYNYCKRTHMFTHA